MRALNLGLMSALSLLAGDALLLTTAKAQTTVATEPVGFVQNTITPATVAGKRVYTPLSFPLRQTAVYTGLVSGVSANTVTLSGASLALTAGTPYLLHVRNGANAAATGQSYPVSASSSTTVTLSSSYQVSTVLGNNDQVSIIPANTLGSIFGSTDSTVLLKGADNPGDADGVYILNAQKGYDLYYYYTGYGWVLSSDANFAIQNNAAILPDEGILVGRVSTNALPASYAISLGTVPVNSQKAQVLFPGLSIISNPFPVSLTFTSFGFLSSPSWKSADNSGDADTVSMYLNGSWKAFYHIDNYGWVRDDDANFAVQDNATIPAGTSLLVRRRGTITPAYNAYIPTALPYSLN